MRQGKKPTVAGRVHKAETRAKHASDEVRIHVQFTRTALLEAFARIEAIERKLAAHWGKSVEVPNEPPAPEEPKP